MSTLTPLFSARSVPPAEERPCYVNQPGVLVSLIAVVSVIAGESVAFATSVCGDYDSKPGSVQRRNETLCALGIALFAPIIITTVAAIVINKLGNRYAARFGVDSYDLIVESGGD